MAKMEEITDVPPILQRMTVNCKSLLSKKTLKAQGIAVDGGADPAGDDDVKEEAGAPPVQQEAVGKMRMAVADYMIPGPKRTITLEVEAGDTVASVMEQVQRRQGYPVALQFLTCDDTPMRPDGGATLAGYNVTKDSKLELQLDLGFAIAADREERRLNKALN
nr:polyubiquitin-like [Setaria viridis]